MMTSAAFILTDHQLLLTISSGQKSKKKIIDFNQLNLAVEYHSTQCSNKGDDSHKSVAVGANSAAVWSENQENHSLNPVYYFDEKLTDPQQLLIYIPIGLVKNPQVCWDVRIQLAMYSSPCIFELTPQEDQEVNLSYNELPPQQRRESAYNHTDVRGETRSIVQDAYQLLLLVLLYFIEVQMGVYYDGIKMWQSYQNYSMEF
ncbi:hypothetical protein L218DRAFT_951210 [Marasmius fiardii PR-910]|nr:hypothetical protein L218DRAFT_951210 [Marasmius fiardii PR-910]